MPNTAESDVGKDPPAPIRAPTRDDEHGFLSPFTRDTARDTPRARRASSAELQLPWTCPVTHTREKFYTVCSDYALLNQARPVLTPRDIPHPGNDATGPGNRGQLNSTALPRGPAGGTHVPTGADREREEVSGHSKPVLAWEIDTTDFDAVLTRKAKTTSESRCFSAI